MVHRDKIVDIHSTHITHMLIYYNPCGLLAIKIEFFIVDLLSSIIKTTFIFKFSIIDDVKVKNTRLSIVSSSFNHYLIKGKTIFQELTKDKRDPFSFYVFFCGNTKFSHKD